MKNAKELLELCRHRFPSPRSGQRHNLTIEGNVLVLTLMLGDTYQRFNIDDSDLDRPVPALVEDLVVLMRTPPPSPDDLPEVPNLDGPEHAA
jgi:hypothetical protein